MKALVAGALLLGLAGCGWRDERIKAKAELHVRKAEEFEEAGRLNEAISEYRRAIALIRGRDKWKTRELECLGIIRQLEGQIGQIAGATAEFEDFKAGAAKVDATSAGDLLKEGRDLYARVRDSGLPWLPELAAILEKLGAAVDRK